MQKARIMAVVDPVLAVACLVTGILYVASGIAAISVWTPMVGTGVAKSAAMIAIFLSIGVAMTAYGASFLRSVVRERRLARRLNGK